MKPNMMIEPTVSQQGMKRNMTTCAELKPRKTYGVALMKTLHCLIAGLRLAFSNAASRIAIPLLVVGMALVFVQPCAALSFQFEETGSMAVARENGTAVLLQNGRVLVAGGLDSNCGPLASAELYDPATGTWTTTGSLAEARDYHTMTLLPDGKVLVAGGVSRTSRERGTLRSGYRDVVRYWQPQ